jgi:hypothetical protein
MTLHIHIHKSRDSYTGPKYAVIKAGDHPTLGYPIWDIYDNFGKKICRVDSIQRLHRVVEESERDWLKEHLEEIKKAEKAKK